MKKLIVTYEDIHNHVKKIADQIKKDNWEPDYIVAIASGGFIPARILRTYLKKDIYVVGLKRYDEDEAVHHVPLKIQWIDEVEKKLTGKKILLVDEVDDTRVTLSYCISELLRNELKELRVAVIHQKQKIKLASFPEGVGKIYYGAEIDDIWIKYPWDALDIADHNKGIE